MKALKIIFLLFFVFIFISLYFPSEILFAQEKGKGDLEDFADDYGEEESDSDSDSDDAVEFFLFAFFDNIGDLLQLWGHTPETEFGPYPSFPYAEGDGFMTPSNNFRSYFFNTEFNYHYLKSNLRGYLFKWETQFVGSSKLSFDLSVYEEDLIDNEFGFRSTDRLTFFGVRYGHALYRTSQLIVNLEGGFRGFHRNSSHGGVEVALDLQLFPQKPLVIETELAAAYVSNGPLYTVESSAGFLLGRFEILGGLRILKNKSADLLDGFRLGLRVWY
ncbi:MAG: hypothetical protein ACE5HX_04120 [bacterium]